MLLKLMKLCVLMGHRSCALKQVTEPTHCSLKMVYTADGIKLLDVARELGARDVEAPFEPPGLVAELQPAEADVMSGAILQQMPNVARVKGPAVWAVGIRAGGIAEAACPARQTLTLRRAAAGVRAAWHTRDHCPAVGLVEACITRDCIPRVTGPTYECNYCHTG